MVSPTPKSSPPFQDDSILEGSARRVMADINQFFSKERLERTAVSDERVRLARELHDGVLQSLYGTLVQLEALSRLIEENPDAARRRLRDIGELIAGEQRELRNWIRNLKPAANLTQASSASLAAALTCLCQRIEKQWGLQVTVTTGGGMVPRTVGDEIYRLVQEAVANAARHAHGDRVGVTVRITRESAVISVADNGLGFPFSGRYDLAALRADRLGPRSLMDRVTSLGGDLVITTSGSGSKVEITIPLRPPVAWGKVPSSSDVPDQTA